MKNVLSFIFFISVSLNAQISKSNVRYLIDTERNLNIDQVLNKSGAFVIAKNNIPSMGIKPEPVWTKVAVNNISKTVQKVMVQIKMPFIDTVQYYIVKNRKVHLKSEIMGWSRILKNVHSPNSTHVYFFVLKPNQAVTIYARTVKIHGTIRVPINIQTEQAFIKENLRKKEIVGSFLGMCLVVICLNLFLYFLIKERVYLLYSFYVFCQILNVDFMEGMHSGLYMNGFCGITGRSLYYISMVLFVNSHILFLNAYLKVAELQPKIYSKISRYLLIVGVIYIGLLVIPETLVQSLTTEKIFIKSLFFTFFFCVTFTIYMVLYAIVKNLERKAAILYLVAGLPLFFATTIQMLGNLKIVQVKSTQRTEYLFPAIGFEILVLCFWLAIRFKIYTDEREKLIDERKKQQQKAIETGLEYQNQERNRLAKELHDGVGLDISIVKMKLESLRVDLEKTGFKTKELAETMTNLDHVASEIRSFSHNLMPPDLENNGIVSVVQNLVVNLQKTNPKIEVNFTNSLENQLPSPLSHGLFFISKELINNAIRHAKASIIDIELIQEKSEVILKIMDDGLGYNIATATATGGLGLKSVLSRIELLNGTFEITAKKSGGMLHQIVFKL